MIQQNFMGKALTAREMKGIKGGNGEKARKNVCVICGPGDVHCASVVATADCEVIDYNASTGTPGWMACKYGSGEGYDALPPHQC
jgi:hypothetical protein